MKDLVPKLEGNVVDPNTPNVTWIRCTCWPFIT